MIDMFVYCVYMWFKKKCAGFSALHHFPAEITFLHKIIGSINHLLLCVTIKIIFIQPHVSDYELVNWFMKYNQLKMYL